METPITDRRKSLVQSLKRRSFACTPARQKDSQSSSTPDSSFNFGSSDPQNDDEAELRTRQKNRVVDLHHNAFASPKSSTEKRRSLVLSNGVTNIAIADHYKSCIKLSTENKITTKNAFDLNLIDYMPYMFSKQDSDLNNFQVASCTLDAGVKIYACRVDAVHTDILKMAGGLGKETENGNENAAEGDENGVAPKTSKKSKAKAKHGENVETNLANIDAGDIESGTRINPLTRLLAGELKFSSNQVKNSGYQYFHALEYQDSMNVLMTHCDSVPKAECTASFREEAAKFPKMPVSFLRDLPKDLENLQICPEAKGFFNPDWKFAEDNFPMSPNKRTSLLPPPFALDDVGEQDQVPPIDEPLFEGMDDAEGSYHDDDGFATTVEQVREAGHAATPPLRLGMATVESVLEKGPSEYSYFSSNAITVMGRAGWAGPLHWKLKPITLGKPKEGGDKDEGNERKKRKKDPLRLRYDENAPDWQLVRAGLVKPKVPMQLSHATCKQWDTAKVTLPRDIHYDTENFGRFDLYPGLRVTFGPSKTVEEVEGVADYDYDSRRDAENFCPASQIEDDHDLNESGGFATCAAFGDTYEAHDGDNLVAEPNKARPEIIPFAKKAKNMDMKKLKSTIWNILKEDSGKPQEAEAMPSNGNAHAPQDFYTLYKKLPSALPPKMASNLSVSLAFIATLHLANENNLMLEGQDDLRTFSINMP